MRKPNGYGSIKKMSGNRRRPFVFVITKNGKQKPMGYFCTQTEAEIYAADYNKKNNRILHGHEITFAELFYRWLPFYVDKHQPSKSTISSYHISFRHCIPLHDMPLKKIKYYHLQDIIDTVKRNGLSYSTCKKIRSTISLMYKYALIMEYVDKSYASLLNLGRNKQIRPHKPFTRQKINKLWANLEIEGVDTVLILIYTGMRIGELLELTKDSVYLRQKYIKITKSKTCNGLRAIPIHEKIFSLIQERMNTAGKNFVCTKDGKPYNYSTYCTVWDKIMTVINARHTTHDCRHTCATLLDNADVNENAKRRILGHSISDVTNGVYTHKDIRQLRKAINKIR
ncbi:site-specific integrase [Megamonas rupellensis]|uniref:tyrosine-type recombinase/integrase n=1 Tax=Megamonas rupellensis TaxID=491921 RepID=UPI00195D001E|nr:site-specific integrase [Megamonas rupellensis]MBM6747911.1 site-specific integrase [Megamonas rupellensis]